MNWLLKKLGYRDRKYRAADFSVKTYERAGVRLHLDGERIGEKWEGISVHIPEDVGTAQAAQIASDLETAFQALGYEYIIARPRGRFQNS